MDFPTNFTQPQLEKIAELLARENSRVGNAPGRIVDPDLHHLSYKADDYARNARAAASRARFAR